MFIDCCPLPCVVRLAAETTGVPTLSTVNLNALDKPLTFPARSVDCDVIE